MTNTLITLTTVLGLCLVPACGKKNEDKSKDTKAKTKPKTNETVTPTEAKPKADPVADAPKTDPAATVSKCPDKTTLTHFGTPEAVAKKGPFDLSTFTFAKAQWDKNKTQLRVFVSNRDWPASKMYTLTAPVKDKGHGILLLSFRTQGKPIAAGTYKDGLPGKNKSGLKVGATIIVAGLRAATMTKGESNIINIADGKICGTFELKGQFDSDVHLAGTFVADIPE